MRSSFPLLPGLLAVTAVLALAACGSNHDELAKRLSSMQAELQSLQAHSDRLEGRLELLEMSKETLSMAPPVSAPSALAPPNLAVVKLEPTSDTQDSAADTPSTPQKPQESANDQGPRPVIRVHGPNSDGEVRTASDRDSNTDSPPSRKHQRQ